MGQSHKSSIQRLHTLDNFRLVTGFAGAGYTARNYVLMATQWLHGHEINPKKQRACY